MPGYNKSGPMGEGPMTGRKEGLCNPHTKGHAEQELQENKNPRSLLGFGRRGWFRLFGHSSGGGRRQGNSPGSMEGSGKRFRNKQ